MRSLVLMSCALALLSVGLAQGAPIKKLVTRSLQPQAQKPRALLQTEHKATDTPLVLGLLDNLSDFLLPSAQRLSDAQHAAKWQRFLTAQNRTYASEDEAARRFGIFRANRAIIVALNDANANKSASIPLFRSSGPFADLDEAEFKSTYAAPAALSPSTLAAINAQASSFLEVEHKQSKPMEIDIEEMKLIAKESGVDLSAAVKPGSPHPLEQHTARGSHSDEEHQVMLEMEAETAVTTGTTYDIDWRSRLTAIKNQGQCNSCWAHTAAEMIEARREVDRRPANAYTHAQSVAWFQDCSAGQSAPRSCSKGGDAVAALNTMMTHRGCSIYEYPYNAGERPGTCKHLNGKTGSMITGVTFSNYCNAAYCYDYAHSTLWNNLKSHGPHTVLLDDAPLQHYYGGILPMSACNMRAYGDWHNGPSNHWVQLVAHGSTNGETFYTIRNSWSASWGESGYFRVSSAHNTCGFANLNVYITAQK